MTTTSGRRPGNRPGPKPRLSREAIVDAALDVGVERLSVAAVASRLGVAPGSIYRYVDGLEELAVAAVEQAFAAAPLPSAERGWRAFLEDEARLGFELLRQYSGLVRDNGADPNALAGERLERVAATLAAIGFSRGTAVRVADAVLDVVADGVATTLWLREGPTASGGLSAPARAVLDRFSPELRGEVRQLMEDPATHVWDKVGLVLDGIEHRAANGVEGYPAPT